MLRLLALARLPGARVLIYAWNPAAIWSFAGDGHVDRVAAPHGLGQARIEGLGGKNRRYS